MSLQGVFRVLRGSMFFFSSPVLMLLYPLYKSLLAMESPWKEDDQQWLTYWVIYSLISFVEFTCAGVLLNTWLQPVYHLFKLGFVAWLTLPKYEGARFLYETYVHSLLKKERLRESIPEVKALLAVQQMTPAARTAVAEIIGTHGPQFFEALIKGAASETRTAVEAAKEKADNLKEKMATMSTSS